MEIRRMRPLLAAVLFALSAAPGFAQVTGGSTAPPTPPAAPVRAGVTDVAPVLVSGEAAGPGLWMVKKDGHVMWVLGTQSPVPAKMTWRSAQVNTIIGESQEVISPPAAAVKADIGFFGKLALLPSLVGARNNPDGRTLDQVLPPELYGRWRVLKEKYIGRDGGVEKYRPIFAAQELYEKAIEKSGLSSDNVVWPVVVSATQQHGVKVTKPKVEITVQSPKSMIKEFKKSPLDDLACFTRTIERLETDLDAMKIRANAWATGDVEAMRALPFTDQRAACEAAIMNATVVEKGGMKDLPTRVGEAWLAAVDTAMKTNDTTFAVLPMSELLKPDGYLAKLAARGYSVDPP
jgi:TraB/PrgY/gumN family